MRQNGCRGNVCFGGAFAISSVLMLFFFGTVIGGIAPGACRSATRPENVITSWLNPTSVVIGFWLFVAAAYPAAVFLVTDARRNGRPGPFGKRDFAGVSS